LLRGAPPGPAYDVTHALRGAFLGGQLREPPWSNAWLVAQARKDLTELMRYLDAHLAAAGPFVAGGAFTLADMPMGLTVNRWFMLDGIERPPLPALAAYYDRLTDRPDYRRTAAAGRPDRGLEAAWLAGRRLPGLVAHPRMRSQKSRTLEKKSWFSGLLLRASASNSRSSSSWRRLRLTGVSTASSM
jgi:hypothetical protein